MNGGALPFVPVQDASRNVELPPAPEYEERSLYEGVLRSNGVNEEDRPNYDKQQSRSTCTLETSTTTVEDSAGNRVPFVQQQHHDLLTLVRRSQAKAARRRRVGQWISPDSIDCYSYPSVGYGAQPNDVDRTELCTRLEGFDNDGIWVNGTKIPDQFMEPAQQVSRISRQTVDEVGFNLDISTRSDGLSPGRRNLVRQFHAAVMESNSAMMPTLRACHRNGIMPDQLSSRDIPSLGRRLAFDHCSLVPTACSNSNLAAVSPSSVHRDSNVLGLPHTTDNVEVAAREQAQLEENRCLESTTNFPVSIPLGHTGAGEVAGGEKLNHSFHRMDAAAALHSATSGCSLQHCLPDGWDPSGSQLPRYGETDGEVNSASNAVPEMPSRYTTDGPGNCFASNQYGTGQRRRTDSVPSRRSTGSGSALVTRDGYYCHNGNNASTPSSPKSARSVEASTPRVEGSCDGGVRDSQQQAGRAGENCGNHLSLDTALVTEDISYSLSRIDRGDGIGTPIGWLGRGPGRRTDREGDESEAGEFVQFSNRYQVSNPEDPFERLPRQIENDTYHGLPLELPTNLPTERREFVNGIHEASSAESQGQIVGSTRGDADRLERTPVTYGSRADAASTVLVQLSGCNDNLTTAYRSSGDAVRRAHTIGAAQQRCNVQDYLFSSAVYGSLSGRQLELQQPRNIVQQVHRSLLNGNGTSGNYCCSTHRFGYESLRIAPLTAKVVHAPDLCVPYLAGHCYKNTEGETPSVWGSVTQGVSDAAHSPYCGHSGVESISPRFGTEVPFAANGHLSNFGTHVQYPGSWFSNTSASQLTGQREALRGSRGESEPVVLNNYIQQSHVRFRQDSSKSDIVSSRLPTSTSYGSAPSQTGPYSVSSPLSIANEFLHSSIDSIAPPSFPSSGKMIPMNTPTKLPMEREHPPLLILPNPIGAVPSTMTSASLSRNLFSNRDNLIGFLASRPPLCYRLMLGAWVVEALKEVLNSYNEARSENTGWKQSYSNRGYFVIPFNVLVAASKLQARALLGGELSGRRKGAASKPYLLSKALLTTQLSEMELLGTNKDDPGVCDPQWIIFPHPFALKGLIHQHDRALGLLNCAAISGLRPSYSCPMVNVAVQLLRRSACLVSHLKHHVCARENCIACELSLLFNNLDLAEKEELGRPCQATNFLSTFRETPEVHLCKLIPDSVTEASSEHDSRKDWKLEQTVQTFLDFILEHLQRELGCEEIPSSAASDAAGSKEAGAIQEPESTVSSSKRPENVVRTLFGNFVELTRVCLACPNHRSVVHPNPRFVVEMEKPVMNKGREMGNSARACRHHSTDEILFEAAFNSLLHRELVRTTYCQKCCQNTLQRHIEKIYRLPPTLLLSCKNIFSPNDNVPEGATTSTSVERSTSSRVVNSSGKHEGEARSGPEKPWPSMSRIIPEFWVGMEQPGAPAPDDEVPVGSGPPKAATGIAPALTEGFGFSSTPIVSLRDPRIKISEKEEKRACCRLNRTRINKVPSSSWLHYRLTASVFIVCEPRIPWARESRESSICYGAGRTERISAQGDEIHPSCNNNSAEDLAGVGYRRGTFSADPSMETAESTSSGHLYERDWGKKALFDARHELREGQPLLADHVAAHIWVPRNKSLKRKKAVVSPTAGWDCESLSSPDSAADAASHFGSTMLAMRTGNATGGQSSEGIGARDSSKGSPAWILVNDCIVTKVAKDEVLAAQLHWKKPILLVYSCDAAMEDALALLNMPKRSSENGLLSPVCSIPRQIILSDNNLSNFPLAPTTPEDIFIPLTVQEAAIIERQGMILALDAEFVMLQRGSPSSDEMLTLARLSVIRGEGALEGVPLIDAHILSRRPPEDYLTQFSGLKAGDLDAMHSAHWLTTRKAVYQKLRYLLDHRCRFVGHGLSKDFAIINIFVPQELIIDTAQLYRLPGRRLFSLQFLARHVLKRFIQVGEAGHNSVEDAGVALELYKKYIQLQEGELRSLLIHLYRVGATSNFVVQDFSQAAADCKVAELMGVLPIELKEEKELSFVPATSTDFSSIAALPSSCGDTLPPLHSRGNFTD